MPAIRNPLHYVKHSFCVGIFCLSNNISGNLFADDYLSADLLSTDLQSTDFLHDDFSLPAPAFEQKQDSWRNYFVTSLSHEQTRDDEGNTKYLRYALRVEYEQAIAADWYARADVKARSFRSLDQQAQQRGKNKGMQTGESYQHLKIHDAWLQYSKNACVYKVGNQTLIWGEVDGTFAVDDVTPFDFTEQLLTDYSSIRLAQTMLVTECFINSSQAQVFFIPEAGLHLLNHNKDAYGLNVLSGIDDKDLDAEWGARYQFRIKKTEITIMFADLVSNFPAQVIPDNTPPNTLPMLIPALSDYYLYGISANYVSGAWQLKTDVAYKTDQLVDGTMRELTDTLDLAAGVEFLSSKNHRYSAGVWGVYAFDHDYTANQNDSTPFVTLSWNKGYLNDDLNMRLLANGRGKPKSVSATLQAQYQYNDSWSASSALTLADNDGATANPLQSQNNEASLQIKYQF